MITEAQIYLTRKCNLNCGHCKVPQRKLNELSLEQWKHTYRIMEKLGIKTVKLLGGEPTVKEWLPDLIKFSNTTSIKTAILSNSLFDEDTREKIAEAKPYGYFASIDSLNDLRDSDDFKKSNSGYKILKSLSKSDIPLLAANIVIHRLNVTQVPDMVRKLSDEGFYVNLCTLQHTKDNDREFSRTNIDPDYMFILQDEFMLMCISTKLIEMKERNFRIAVPESYIEKFHSYGLRCNWQCKDPTQLRIDADGGMMLCNEYRTKLADNYNILRMTEEKYEEFLSQWYVARRHINCDGCYWSCFLQAEDNIKNSKLEFHYVA